MPPPRLAVAMNTVNQRVRLSGPAEIVEAVPHLVGFHPKDSLVVVALKGKRRRVGVVARIDLPDPEHVVACADYVVDFLRRDGASSAIAVCYPPDRGRDHPAVAALAAALRDRFDAVGLAIADLLCVSDGRWWSLLCDDPKCCPSGGTPIDDGRTSQVAAAMAVAGRVTLGSREELAGMLRPVGGLAGTAMHGALSRATAAFNARLAAGRRDVLARESVDLLAAAVQQRLDARPVPLGVEDAARLVVGLADVRVRDEAISWFEGDWGDAALGMFSELVRMAVPPFDTTPLTVLAWLSYLRGDGAFAGMALDRILESGTGNGLVPYLDALLRGGIGPDAVRPIVRTLRKAKIG